MANVSQLQPTFTPQVQTSSSEASDKDADFIALRLLNKRARLKLSPAPLDLTSVPGKASLFATVNSKGWFAAVTREPSGASALILSPLADLRAALEAAPPEDEQTYRPRTRVQIDGAPPHILTFACNDTRLLLGSVDGLIRVYASDHLFSAGQGPVQPMHVFATSSSTTLLSIQPNPGEIPELVAVLRDSTNNPGSLAVELLDVQKLISSGGWMAGKSPSTTPTSISWSPKGKQLALGLQSGDIVTFSPTATATPKSNIPHPPSASNMSVISVHWLSAASFYTIYAPPGQLAPDAEQIHFHASLDSKNNSAQDIRFNNPYLPFPGLRPPGEFLVCLRGWDPSKVLLFVGDSTSSDIGLIGSVADGSGERWHNLSLEETSTPSLPLDKDQNDTILLGMDVDLTSNESYLHSTASGEALELPAHPIMYVYASDGTILGWHVLNATGVRYPGMITAPDATTLAPSFAQSATIPVSPSVPEESMATDDAPSGGFGLGMASSEDADSKPSIFGKTSFPTSSVQQSTDGSLIKPGTGFGAFSGFDQSSPFAKPPAFSTTPTQQPTVTFGAPAFQGATRSAFGRSSESPEPKPFSMTMDTSATPSPTSTPSTTPGPFSTTFGNLQTTPAVFVKPASGSFGELPRDSPFFTPKPLEPKPAAAFALSFASGTPTSTPPKAGSGEPAFGMSSMPGAEVQSDSNSKSTAFGKTGFSVPSGQQSTDSGLIKPGTGFGSFAGAQTSSFGNTQASATTFGFGAFASGTQSAFAAAASKNGPSAKPVWAVSEPSKPPESSPLGETTNMFGKPSEPPEPKTPATPPKTVDSTKSSIFPSSAPGPSTGAFSNLQTMPAAFVKPATGGFGEPPRDSPFFAPKAPESKPVSAFSLSGTPGTPTSTPPKTGLAQPAFGVSSMPGAESPRSQESDSNSSGFGKTSFAVPSSQQSADSGVIKPGIGFGSFAGTKPSPFSSAQQASPTFGFGGFASNGPSAFGKPAESPEPKAPSAVPSKSTGVFGFSSSAPSLLTGAFGNLQTTPSAFTRSASVGASKDSPSPPPSLPESKPVSVFTLSATPGAPTLTSPKASPPPASGTTPPPPVAAAKDVEVKVGETLVGSKDKAAAETVLSQEFSVESVSSATTSSFVQVSAEEEGELESELEDSEESEEGVDEEESEEGSEGVYNEEFEEGYAGGKEGEDEDEEDETVDKGESEVSSEAADKEERMEKPTTPAVARSPSTTPKAEHPKVAVSAPPPMPPPALKASPPPPLPFALSARSNNRPIRSSPLASTPIVLDGDVVKPPAVSKSAPPTIVAQAATPKGFFGQPAPHPPAQFMDGAKAPPVMPLFPVAGEKPVWGMPPKPEVTPAAIRTPPSLFASPISSGVPSPSTTPPLPKPPSSPSPTPEQGMQTECLLLLATLHKELENLVQLARVTSLRSGELKRTSGVAHRTADLGDARKWDFGDIEEYGRVLMDVQTDVRELKLQRVSLRKATKELDSNILKVNTRKEEIVRFSKAKTDAEFAKMLKIRTLAPEYLESQSQLRKNIRVMRDRVQKLEDHLQASKRRINELRTGRPSIRPPSLDTVNRTFRNIDTAIDQQRQDLTQLRHRMTKLEISGAVGARDQLAVSSSSRPLNVTPNVAVTTAAALNAERSAQRLKKAMLTSRTQPLLNTTATASPVPTSFQTPQKATAVKPEVKTPESAFGFPTTPTMHFPSSLPSWTPPSASEFESPGSHDPSPSRNRAVKHHSKPIVLKKNVSPAVSTTTTTTTGMMQPPMFEWKPVEPIKPASSLPFSLRPAGSS